MCIICKCKIDTNTTLWSPFGAPVCELKFDIHYPHWGLDSWKSWTEARADLMGNPTN